MIRRNQPNRHAAAAVELALVLPVLMFMWVLAIDWGRIFYYTVTIEAAARDGAYFASNYPGIYDYTSASDAALGESTNITPTPTVTITYDTSYNGTYTSPSAPSSGGYVQCEVDYTFTTITNFPIIGGSTTLKRYCKMAMAPLLPTF